MRIHRPSRCPAGSVAPSSTSKELLRRSPRLSGLLHPHSAALTCSTRTATSSLSPRTKQRPTRHHQRGCTLIASHLLLNSTSRHRWCSISHPPWSGYLEAGAAGDIFKAALPQCEAPSAAASIPAGSATAAPALARSLTRPAAAAALPLARAAALLRLSHTSVD